MPTADGSRVWAYCRSSTSKQTESVSMQKGIIREYLRKSGLPEPDGFFCDPAMSAKKLLSERPAGKELLERLMPGDHFVIAKLDRAFRRVNDAAFVMDKLNSKGIKIHICNFMGGAVDLTTPLGRFMIHIMAACAELERGFVQERVREGMAHAAAKGQQFGGTPPPGKRNVKRLRWDGKMKIVRVDNDEERAIMAKVVELRDVYNLSFDQIRIRLSYKPWVDTPTLFRGRDFGKYTIRNMYNFEKKWREQEALAREEKEDDRRRKEAEAQAGDDVRVPEGSSGD